ncbi:hypothetical protein WJT86_10770 [Microvirga sp. W0021]|uniref:DUF1499 domain-containing protein n=1 Tax=Hohaiivirga grylli TaxID=3133970 RepID=A0ABV0BMX7_9HYPH
MSDLNEIKLHKSEYIKNILYKNEGSKLYEFIVSEMPEIKYAYCFSWTPSQTEEIYSIITDKREKISIEFPYSSDSRPFIVSRTSLYKLNRKKYSRGMNRFIDAIEKAFRENGI